MFKTGMHGKYKREFEERMAEYLAVKNVVTVSPCTLGLLLSYHGPGFTREVIVPSFTFMATAHPVVWAAQRRCLSILTPRSGTLTRQRLTLCHHPRTTAIVAVHNFGNPAPVAELEGIPVIPTPLLLQTRKSVLGV